MVAESLHHPKPPVGVIESISQGFEMAAGRLALLLIPILLDLFLWLGPRVSYLSFVQDVVLPRYAEMRDEQGPAVSDLDSDADSLFEQFAETQYWPVMGFPPLVGFPPRVGFPPLVSLSSLLAAEEAKTPPVAYTPPIWTIESGWDMVGLLALSLALGIIAGTLYVTLIGHQVADGQVQWARAAVRLPIMLTQVTTLALLALFVFVVIMLPFLLVAVLLFKIFEFGGQSDAGFVMAVIISQIGLILALWFEVFGVFTIHGIIINRRGLVGALWDSIRVVQWNMSGTLTLLLLIVLLNWGLQQLFRLSDLGTWLAPVAISAYAFASTALIASTFVFFKDRYRYWREVRSEMLAELSRRRT
jgi:hypothetical protein